MATNELQELITYIDGLIDSTRNGIIDWTKANPTTFVWNISPPHKGKIILQRASTHIRTVKDGKPTIKSVNNFVLQAVDGEGNVVLSVNSQQFDELENKLEQLFDMITSGLSRRGLDFIKSILPPKQ